MTREEKIREFLEDLNTDVQIMYYVDEDNVVDYDDVYNQIEENQGFNQEVIYYSNAMEYLTEHDPSLKESMQLAAYLGYSPENINSELLASLLKSQKVREDFEDFRDEIEKFFYDVEDDE